MKVWRALLWKEGREELPKVLVGLGLCAVVVALRQNAEFNGEFVRDFEGWIMSFIVVCGVALGMGLVAKESSKGTLSFLSGKPLSVVEVLLPKYVVGAVALLVLAAGAWVTVYVDLEGLASKGFSIYSGGGAWYPSVKRIVEEVGYVNMLLVSLMSGLIAYSVIFACSTVADHPLKGAALGTLLLIVLVPSAYNVLKYFPALEPFFSPDPGISFRGTVVRIVGDPWGYLVRLGATAVVMAAGVAISIALLRRFRGVSIGWKPIVIGWLALIAFIIAMDMTSEPRPPRPRPLSVLTPEEGAYLDLAVVGDRGYMATEGGLAVVDLRDPTKPELLAAVEVPQWLMSRVAVVDSLVYLLGQRKGLPADSLGIAVFSLGDPAHPVFKGYRIIGDDIEKFWGWDRCGEGLILSGRWGDKLGIVSFALDAEGLPARADELVVEELPEGYKDDFGGWWEHKLSMHVHNERIWVGYRDGFLAVDARNLGELQETVRVDMGDYNSEYDSHKSRPIAREGNTLYVRRYWPGDLVAFDITDPNRPREIGYWFFDAKNTIKIIDDWVYSTAGNGLFVDRLTDYHAYEDMGYWQVPDELRSSSSISRNWKRLHLVRDHFYTLIGRSLIVFSPEQIKGGRL
ncbi:MAG: ABC transporter permease subunit [Gemmatimonadetes bacterium]|nr:ABC transporter permease subunit [Gemmatimonadota bacterium]MYI63129.1 ABC transporter permease subunit [Gemmatimonadota bacterium]